MAFDFAEQNVNFNAEAASAPSTSTVAPNQSTEESKPALSFSFGTKKRDASASNDAPGPQGFGPAPNKEGKKSSSTDSGQSFSFGSSAGFSFGSSAPVGPTVANRVTPTFSFGPSPDTGVNNVKGFWEDEDGKLFFVY